MLLSSLTLISLVASLGATQTGKRPSVNVTEAAAKWSEALRNASLARRELLPIVSKMPCSPYCMQVQGDGQCQDECASMSCLRDMGDCTGALPSCDLCRFRDCDWQCALSGCEQKGKCELENDTHEYVLLDLPSISANVFHAHFHTAERRVERKTGLHFELVGNRVGPGIWAHNRDDDSLVQMKYNSFSRQHLKKLGITALPHTRALFRLSGPSLVTYGHRVILDVIARLGAKKERAVVTLLVLSGSETQEWDPSHVDHARSVQEHGTESPFYTERKELYGEWNNYIH